MSVMMQGKGDASSATATAPFMGLGPRMMTGDKEKMGRKKLPSPKEMVAHYESKGMHPQEASLKVIEDLQNLLLRVVATKKTSTHILTRLESKLDSKPGYPQTLAIGIASGAFFHALPHLTAIWNHVTNTSPS